MKELHATIQSMVSKAVKHKSKKRKASKEVHFAESDSDSENSAEELNEFNELNLKKSKSDSDDASSTDSEIYT